MALIKCKTCGASISKNAGKCPQCGENTENFLYSIMMLGIVSLVTFVVVMTVFFVKRGDILYQFWKP